MRYFIETTKPDMPVSEDPLFKTIYHDQDLAWEKAKELASEYEAPLFIRYQSPDREYLVPVLDPDSV